MYGRPTSQVGRLLNYWGQATPHDTPAASAVGVNELAPAADYGLPGAISRPRQEATTGTAVTAQAQEDRRESDAATLIAEPPFVKQARENLEQESREQRYSEPRYEMRQPAVTVGDLERVMRFVQDRVTSLETKLESALDRQDSRSHMDMEILRRLQGNFRDHVEENKIHLKDTEHKVQVLDDLKVRQERELATAKEQIRSLQIDFRDFAVQAVSRQREDLQNMVKDAFQAQRESEEDHRLAAKKNHALVTEDMNRLNSLVADVEEQVNHVRTELKQRCSALENTAMGGGGGSGGALDPAVSQALTALRSHLEMMRQSNTHLHAAVSELQSRFDESQKKISSFQEGSDNRNEQIERRLLEQAQQLATDFNQQIDVLASKCAVDKSDLLARQAMLKEDMVANGDTSTEVFDHKIRELQQALGVLKKREDVERNSITEYMNQKLQQFVQSYTAAEDARTSSLSSLYQRVEGFQEKQIEQMRTIRGDITENVSEMQNMLRSEITNRLTSEQKLGDSIRDAMKFLAQSTSATTSELQTGIAKLEKQFNQSKLDSGDRAERLSRYVDEAVGKVRGSADRGTRELEDNVNSVAQRLKDIVAEVKDVPQQVHRDLDKQRRETELRLRQFEDSFAQRCNQSANVANESKKAVEHRTNEIQREFSQRLEMYIGQFDANIASLQAAILNIGRDRKSDDT
eukprot:gene449-899_t